MAGIGGIGIVSIGGALSLKQSFSASASITESRDVASIIGHQSTTLFEGFVNASERRDKINSTARMMLFKGKIYGRENTPVIEGKSLEDQNIFAKRSNYVLKMKI